MEDESSGRFWTSGCINASVLPSAPLSSAEELVASLTSAGKRSAEQNALVEARFDLKRRMRLAIEEWTARLNRERWGGYDDWRLPTLEEAMSLMSRRIRTGGVYISELFSDHEYVRTADGSPGPQLPGQEPGRAESVWIVGYGEGDCVEVGDEAPIPLRFVRTDFD